MVTALALLGAELVARALAPLPLNRTWPDAESQFKAEHALAVHAAGQTEPVVFGGSSVSDAAFDPAEVMRTAHRRGGTFSYAQEGSLSKTTADYLRVAVIDQVHPQVVIVGVLPGDIGVTPSNAASLGNQLEDSRGFRLANGNPTVGDRIDDVASRHSALIAHREAFRDPYLLFRYKQSGSTPVGLDPNTGALLTHRQETYVPPDVSTPDAESTTPVGPQLDALRGLARRLADRHARLVLVELPALRSGFAKTFGLAALVKGHRAVLSVDRSTCAERIDLRSMLQDQRYWSSFDHMNGKGTVLVSRAVGRWLRDHPTGRTDC